MNKTNPEISLDDIVPVKAYVDTYPHHGSQNTWRWRIAKRHENGLADAEALVKRDGTWYVVTPCFRTWLLCGRR